jgi:two-component system OmpR family response regulator
MNKALKILYVDDEPDIRSIVEFALEDEEGIELKLCASGPEALNVVVNYQPDLLLLDVMMPGMDGPTTLQRMRELPSMASVPAIFITAKVRPNEVEEFKAMGALDVIPKPFDPMSLADQVRALYQRSHHD